MSRFDSPAPEVSVVPPSTLTTCGSGPEMPKCDANACGSLGSKAEKEITAMRSPWPEIPWLRSGALS